MTASQILRRVSGKTSRSVYVIAEMACSHEGDPALARKIIDGAAEAGADAIQFQIWTAAALVAREHPTFEKISRLELKRSDWRDLAAYVKTKYPQLEIVACAYETESVAFAETLPVSAYKIHAIELSNRKLLETVAATGKRVHLCAGAARLGEIEDAVAVFRGAVPSVWLLYGYQSFPTRPDDVHLNYMLKLKEMFELPVGYQDHSDADSPEAFWLPAASIGMGVDVLEKHITHDRSKKGVDHESALNPDEFADFVRMVRRVEQARGLSVPHAFSDDQAKYRSQGEKVAVTRRELAEGSKISQEDILFVRGAGGFGPGEAAALVGGTVCRGLRAFQTIRREDIR